jgi:hypothetical protein
MSQLQKILNDEGIQAIYRPFLMTSMLSNKVIDEDIAF